MTPTALAPSREARLERERQFHDAQAQARADYYSRRPDEGRFADADYLRHASWVGPALAMLGDVNGRRVLDVGCGHGMASVVLARRGAIVSAIDLSAGYAAEAAWRAECNGVAVDVRAADAEELPFADGSFDAVFGNAIFHHLDRDRAAREFCRVLRPGGVLVLCEPWAGNPAVERLRRGQRGRHTDDERSLGRADVAALGRWLRVESVTGFDLFAAAEGKLPRLRGVLRGLDRGLFALVPALRRWGRYVVVRAVKL